jgi:oligopeptide/dipeptide ABC transporter ATP-binding protein
MYSGRIVEEGKTNALFSPLHPYTRALTGAIPSKDKRGKNLENIPGKVPSIEDSFSGCPFAPRCPKAQSICTETFPPVTETDKDRVYCYFPHTGEAYA